MTVMAAEAGTAALEGEAAEATSVSRSATSKRAARSSAAAPAARPDAPSRPQRSRSGGNRRPVEFSLGSGGSNYHAVILAEFVLAVLLVAATPFAKKNQAGVSPYAGRDMVQLLSLTLLYFLLALVAGTGGQRARFSAWFGGLILLTVGLAEAANIAKAVTSFFGAGSSGSSDSGSAGSPELPNITAGVGDAALNALQPAAGTSRNVPQDPRTPGASN